MKKIISFKTKANLELFLVLVLLLFSFGFTLYQNLTVNHWHHYGLLAQSFLQGRTDIQEKPEKLLDTVLGKGGRYYFFNDPLPGILMIPFVLVGGARVSQGCLDFLVTVTSAFLLWKILENVGKKEVYSSGLSRKIPLESTRLHAGNSRGLSLITRMWLILIFFFASNIVSVIWSPHPWFLAQNIGVMWVLWLIYEWQGKRRIAVLFMLMFLLTLTKKIMTFPIATYFFLDSLYLQEEVWKRATRLGLMVLAVLLGSLILLNYQRIGVEEKVLLNFYNFAQVEPAVLEKVKKYGFWSLAHLPTNFVNYFLAGPVVVRENPVDPHGDYHAHIALPYLYPHFSGISFFFLGPIFLSLFFLPLPDFQKVLPVLGATGVWAGTYLTYHASGAAQFGSRYGAEAVPYLFLLLAPVLAVSFSKRAKIIVIGSILMNMFLFRSLISFFMNP